MKKFIVTKEKGKKAIVKNYTLKKPLFFVPFSESDFILNEIIWLIIEELNELKIKKRVLKDNG